MAEKLVQADGSKARLRAALDRIAPELATVDAGSLARVNADVPAAVSTVLGCLPKLRSLRPRIVEELPMFDVERFDRLEDYTLALLYAHGAYLLASQPARSIEEVAAEASRQRELLLGDAMALAARGLFDKQRIAKLQLGAGYQDLVEDLVALVNLYRSRWTEIEKKTGIAADELDLIEIHADRLITRMGLRDHSPVAKHEAIVQRARVFALFIRAYRDARRAVEYLRAAEKDADSFAPTLFGGRRPPEVDASVTEELEQVEEMAPPEEAEARRATGARQPAPRGSVPRVSSGSAAGALHPVRGKIGMPDSDPFTE